MNTISNYPPGAFLFQGPRRSDPTPTAPKDEPGQAFDPGSLFHTRVPALDAEGALWNCRVVGGACVIRILPDGTVDRIIDLPCTWPTSCAFGGEDLRTLFITSARFTMSPEHLAANPSEGAPFAVNPGVGGLPPNLFGA